MAVKIRASIFCDHEGCKATEFVQVEAYGVGNRHTMSFDLWTAVAPDGWLVSSGIGTSCPTHAVEILREKGVLA